MMPTDALTPVVVARITEARRAQDLSSSQLAADAGHTPAAVLMIENGKRGLTFPMLERLAKALGIDPWVLLRAPDVPCPRCAGEPPEGFRCGLCGRAG